MVGKQPILGGGLLCCIYILNGVMYLVYLYHSIIHSSKFLRGHSTHYMYTSANTTVNYWLKQSGIFSGVTVSQTKLHKVMDFALCVQLLSLHVPSVVSSWALNTPVYTL